VAYAEKRGDYWRGRYRNLPGRTPKWGTVSVDKLGQPFQYKQDALDAANDKEAAIRQAGANWKDPSRGDILLDDYVDRHWWPAQDLETRTRERYEQYLKHQISPAFGERSVNSLISREEIAAWELAERRRYSKSTAAGARTLLSTILGDAKKAGLVDVNAAERQRGRGRKKNRPGGRRRRVSNKVWTTPLDVLLVAERTALLTGQDDDFVMWVTVGWGGLRWGEVQGLEQPAFRLSKLFVDQQLSEEAHQFQVADPKDESFRNDDPEFFGALDLPPFLSDLLSRQMQARAPRPCRCRDGRCGGRRFLFLGPAGGHHRRGNYSTRFWRPACDGVYPAETGKRPRAARPVLVDLAGGWPGAPLKPAWPYAAAGEEWEPPSGNGWTRHYEDLGVVLSASCPACGAGAGEPCMSRNGRATTSHRLRVKAAQERTEPPALGSWLPLKPGLTPHGLRHGHNVWMDEDGIKQIMKFDRLGHVMPGIGGTYSHVSASMRAELKEALQKRWEAALAARARLSGGSPVRMLDELLAARRETPRKVISRASPKTG
jgi:hypothetical protein